MIASDRNGTTLAARPREAPIVFERLPPKLRRWLAEMASQGRLGTRVGPNPNERAPFPIAQIDQLAHISSMQYNQHLTPSFVEI
jgi:hypothetical protein